MYVSRARVWPLVLMLVLVSGCGLEPAQGRESGADEPASTSSVAEGEIVRPTVRGQAAPFDPCTVLSWDDLPPEVRHPQQRPPRPWRGPESNPLLVDAGCRLENSLVTVGGTEASHEVFLVIVAWSPKLIYDAGAYHARAEPASIEGRPALISPSTGHNGMREIRMCYVAMRAEGGGAAVEVANNRFRVDECELAVRLARLVARRIP